MDAVEPTPRALLLTDVVDSTSLAVELGDAASAQLSTAHDRLARDLLRQWRGREIDRSDGMLMLFDAANDAVAFGIAYHDVLGSLSPPLRARVGPARRSGGAARELRAPTSSAAPSRWRSTVSPNRSPRA